jgi:hypothetical protein
LPDDADELREWSVRTESPVRELAGEGAIMSMRKSLSLSEGGRAGAKRPIQVVHSAVCGRPSPSSDGSDMVGALTDSWRKTLSFSLLSLRYPSCPSCCHEKSVSGKARCLMTLVRRRTTVPKLSVALQKGKGHARSVRLTI